ncbi:MAG: hypothetical protein AAFY26_09115 [Cyanobacteria bacterium J06638_22]
MTQLEQAPPFNHELIEELDIAIASASIDCQADQNKGIRKRLIAALIGSTRYEFNCRVDWL